LDSDKNIQEKKQFGNKEYSMKADAGRDRNNKSKQQPRKEKKQNQAEGNRS